MYDRIDKEHLLLIGRIIAECGYLESNIQTLIWKISGLDSIDGRSITTHMGLRSKLQSVCSLSNYHYKGKEIDDEIQKLAKLISEIATHRNEIVHNPWASSGVKGVSVTSVFKARGKLQVELKEIGTKDLKFQLKRVVYANKQLKNIIEFAF